MAQTFGEIIEELSKEFPKDKYPTLDKKLKSLQFKFLHTERRMNSAETELENIRYKLNKAEEKLKVHIPDKTVKITLKIFSDKMKGIVELVEVSEKDKGIQELIDKVIGKEEESDDLTYFLSQLENRGYTVNIDVKRNGGENK